MKKILVLVLFSVLLMACSESKEKMRESTEEIDVERYEAYIDVLEDIIKRNVWPDGSMVLEDPKNSYIEANQFAICDVNGDEKEELVVSITSTYMAGMEARIYDYDTQNKEVVLRWCGFPALYCYSNGVIREDASHNHTDGAAIWPYTLHWYDQETGTYNIVGSAYCEEREWSGNAFPEELDRDNDGVIYYISDVSEGYQDKPVTEKEYKEWCVSYVKGSKKIYIPETSIAMYDVEALKELIKIEGACIPIRLAYETTISQFDITGDGSEDDILITCEEPWDESWGLFGSDWQISINGEKAHDFEWNENISLEVDLYEVSDTRKYLLVRENEPNNDDISRCALYQVKDGKLEQVCDFYNPVVDSINSFHYGVEILYMTKDKISTRCFNQFNATAYLEWDMEYAYVRDEWKVSGTEYSIYYDEYWTNKEDGMTANQEFPVYTGIDCKREAFLAEEGDVLLIDRLCIEDGAAYFRVTNEEGKVGWFKDPDEASRELENGEWLDGYFEEAMFAG